MGRLRDLERCYPCGASVGIYETVCPACGATLFDEKLEILRRLRDDDWVTDDALIVMTQLLEEGSQDVAKGPVTSIRMQVGDLRPADLERFPIWEFAIDEEADEDGQDEETVKPRPDLDRADPAQGIFIVRTEFVAADGTRFEGYASPEEDAEIFVVQPVIVTDEGQVHFWFGLFPPPPDLLEASYRILGKTAKELFPVRYRALVEHAAPPLQGEVAAFMHHESLESEAIVSVS